MKTFIKNVDEDINMENFKTDKNQIYSILVLIVFRQE